EGCVSNLTVCNWAYSGKLEEVKETILANKSLARRTDQDRSALHWADCKSPSGKGAQVNAVNQNGSTPLHHAVSKNRHEIAVMLLEGEANPDVKDHYEATAKYRATAKGNLKMIHILLYYKASTNIQDTEGNTPPHLVCDKSEEAKLLVRKETPQVAKGGLGLILKRMVGD
ncbi:hypothetical protein H8957_016345, partial [Semnopithecus entellus]